MSNLICDLRVQFPRQAHYPHHLEGYQSCFGFRYRRHRRHRRRRHLYDLSYPEIHRQDSRPGR